MRSGRAVALLLASLPLFGACRIRRERPNTQPAVHVTTRAESSTHEAGVPIAPVSTTEPIGSATSPVQLPTSPVHAPDGVVVIAATSAYVEAGTIKSSLDSVRFATMRLLEGASGSEVVMSGLIPFEQAQDVPVAHGAPLRRGNERPQCDAVLLDARGRLFGVGAVADLESPARLAMEVYDRDWGFIVGDGAQTLASQVGIARRRWSLEVDQQIGAASEHDMDAGTPEQPTNNGRAAGVAQERDPTDMAITKSNEDAGTAPSEATPPSIAVVMLRDREGRFFVAAEDCGILGAPVGQLTTLAREGTALFVGEEGAVFVAGGFGLARDPRHAERIYRRLVMVQVPKVTADWGLRTTAGASWVIVISRLGSAIASLEPIVWARNHSDGESSTQVPSPHAAAVVAAAVTSAQVYTTDSRPIVETQPPSPVESSRPTVDRTSQSRILIRHFESAGHQLAGTPGTDGSTDGHGSGIHVATRTGSSPATASAPKSGRSAPGASERDAGQP